MPTGISQEARERGRARREAAKTAARAASTYASTRPGVLLSPPPQTTAQKEAAADDGLTRLSDFPDFRGPSRLLKTAQKAMAEVLPPPIKGNAKKKAAKDAARKIDAFAMGISMPLREQLGVFRSHLQRLSPFEAALAKLTLDSFVSKGGLSLMDSVQQYDVMRRAVVRAGKESVAVAANATSQEEAKAALEEGIAAVEGAFTGGSGALLGLIATAQTLRKLPKVDDECPVAVLVGMPNVGKSSIVTATSTGTPEINSYPFTTRGLKLGHVGAYGAPDRYQLMDTPGVLSRSEEERNAMEGLTLAAVQLLPSAVIFVMDLSGTCGEQSAPRLQLKVREQIRAAFPLRPWIDVRSKADLPLADDIDPGDVPPGTLSVSVHEGSGIDELSRRMSVMVAEVRRLREAPEEGGSGAGPRRRAALTTDVDGF